MPRYIDAEKLIKKIFPVGLVDGGKYTINAKAVKCAIDSIPTADVVDVVRCKDCALRGSEDCAMFYRCDCGAQYTWETDIDFCSYGEKIEET